jgi:4'-phosphopantetheinyl transferase EntD
LSQSSKSSQGKNSAEKANELPSKIIHNYSEVLNTKMSFEPKRAITVAIQFVAKESMFKLEDKNGRESSIEYE